MTAGRPGLPYSPAPRFRSGGSGFPLGDDLNLRGVDPLRRVGRFDGARDRVQVAAERCKAGYVAGICRFQTERAAKADVACHRVSEVPRGV